MDIEINYRPSQTAAKIKLNQAEGFYAEGGSMIAMSGGVDIETSTHQKNKGGLFSGIKRMLAGENFFLKPSTSLEISDNDCCISLIAFTMSLAPLKFEPISFKTFLSAKLAL